MLYIYHMKFSQHPPLPPQIKVYKGWRSPYNILWRHLGPEWVDGVAQCHSMAPLGVSPVPIWQGAGWAWGPVWMGFGEEEIPCLLWWSNPGQFSL